MATNTFGGVMRTFGGGRRDVVTPAPMLNVLPFHFDPTAVNTTALTISSTNTTQLVLPAGAIVDMIQGNFAATGGVTPTVDLGWIGVDDAAALDVDGLIAEGDADVGGSFYSMGAATAGAGLGTVLSATQPVRLTGGVGASAATGGVVTGFIYWHMDDDASA